MSNRVELRKFPNFSNIMKKIFRKKVSISFYVLIVTMLLANLTFFYLFLISLKAVFLTIVYFMLAVLLPGYLISRLFIRSFFFAEEGPSWQLKIPLITIFGLANVLFSYLLAKILNISAANYFFCWPYLLLFFNLRQQYYVFKISSLFSILECHRWQLVILLFFMTFVNILVFLMRPTPGVLAIDIFHDHVWNAGHTASLVSNFPLRTLNIETRPYMGYHVLFHVLGAHLAMISGLTPHLVGLQFIFVGLIPLLICNLFVLLSNLVNFQSSYLFYGFAVIIFGGGLHFVHEVKVNSLLNSSTNFIGVLILFAILSVVTNLKRISNVGNFVVIFLCTFLAVVSKGSIGASLLVGILLWTLWQGWKRTLIRRDIIVCFAVILGFLCSYYLFFVFPVSLNPDLHAVSSSDSFPILPFQYVTQNALSSGIVYSIYKHLSFPYNTFAHILFGILIFPLHVLFYYSYRLLIIYIFLVIDRSIIPSRFVAIILGSWLFAYSLEGDAQDHAYFLTSALLVLDISFVVYLQCTQIFSQIRQFHKQRKIYALIGSCVILILPFLTTPGWIKDGYKYNFFVYGKVGVMMDNLLRNSAYKKAHQLITPDLYETLQYIRTDTPESNTNTVISSLISINDGRPLAFYPSAFSEHAVFLGGYNFGDIRGKVPKQQIEKRLAILDGIYNSFEVPDELRTEKYLFLMDHQTTHEIEKRYHVKVLYNNENWNVVKIGEIR